MDFTPRLHAPRSIPEFVPPHDNFRERAVLEGREKRKAALEKCSVETQRFRTILDTMERLCLVCLEVDGRASLAHTMQECPAVPGNLKHWVGSIKRAIRYDKDVSVCYACHLSTIPDLDIHENYYGVLADRGCHYPNLVFSLLVLTRVDSTLEWMPHFKRLLRWPTSNADRELGAWLSKRNKEHHSMGFAMLYNYGLAKGFIE